jgi:hypothetical protein
MKKREVEDIIKKGEWRTVRELRTAFNGASIAVNGSVEVIIGDWRVILGKVDGIYEIESITKKNSL